MRLPPLRWLILMHANCTVWGCYSCRRRLEQRDDGRLQPTSADSGKGFASRDLHLQIGAVHRTGNKKRLLIRT
jgi:hypothetical protein